MERKIIERLRSGATVRAVARELEVGRPRVREVRDRSTLAQNLGSRPSANRARRMDSRTADGQLETHHRL